MPDLRLAYFSPLPPARSGIADFSAELLPFLTEQAEITLFAADPAGVAPEITAQFPVLPVSAYPDLRFQFDFPLYHMGNSLHHEAIYQTMRRYPGVMVLHDFHLHDLIGSITAGRDDFLGYSREIGYVRGPAGLNQLRDLQLASFGVDVPPEAVEAHINLAALPLSNRLVDLSLGVICHSDYVKQKITALNADRPVAVIPLLVRTYNAQSLRRKLPWPADALVFATIGFITPDKCLDKALEAFARLRQSMPLARYLIVGQVLGEVDLAGLIAQYQLQDVVQQVGFAPDLDTYVNWMATADVLVNLRNPTTGETSASVLRGFAASRPVIVYDHGWYGELPAAICRQVPLDDPDTLLAVMQELADSPGLRQHIGHQASAFIQAHHHPRRIAELYGEFLTELRKRFPIANDAESSI